jgi:RNA polymerase sigma-70 factor (ECF subfamily)
MSDSAPSDEELVATFRAKGEAHVLDMLIRRHVGKVQAMIHQMVPSRDDADDLTQEVFVRAIRGLGRFEGRAQFSTWLYRIGMNTVRTFLRQQKRSPLATESLADRADPRSVSPDEGMARNEVDGEIADAVGSLSPPLRSAIVLTVIQGFDAGEAARIEDCSPATIYWRVHKARKLLRQKLEKYLA